MKGVEASAEKNCQHNNPNNIYVELNNPELLQTVNELKDELQTIKIDSEIIMAINQMLLDNMHNRGKDKKNVYETYSETMSYKHK